MHLYVGTTMERGLAIIKEGKIRYVVDRIHGDSYGDLTTSDGFVYLTDKVPIAIYYGKKAQIGINPIAETGVTTSSKLKSMKANCFRIWMRLKLNQSEIPILI